MRREQQLAYRDQFEYLADCFELIRKRIDAFNLRSEAMEAERMVRYSERSGAIASGNQLLEIYRGIQVEIHELETAIQRRKSAAEQAGRRFGLDQCRRRFRLQAQEVEILLVLLYNESHGRGHARFSTGSEILSLICAEPVETLQASRFLQPEGALFQAGLIRCVTEDETAHALRASYEVTEKTLREVAGMREREMLREPGASHRAATAQREGPYRILDPRVSLDQVVLTPQMRERLEEVIWQAEDGRRLMKRWGLEAVLEKGKGTVVLFSGPPGTGKTMTAEAMARRLGRPLFVADYSQLESKWIGETEKNIVTVFRAAAEAGAVLLLDEADAILACRVDGGQYNERAYNRQVAILLTELEAFEGLCILTSNRPVNLDEGLARRMAASFDFPIPGAEERARIWRKLLPSQMPLAEDVDVDTLARRFVMAGGHIRNVILAAARRAALRDGDAARLRQTDFLAAADKERQSFLPESRAIGFRERPGVFYA